MEELNINNLPAEIIAEVFRYLNEKNLKNATMVCKRWNNLVNSVFRWSLELDYGKRGKLLNTKTTYILKSNRKFGTIGIYGEPFNKKDRIVDIFKSHGSNVVELHLNCCRIYNLTGFAQLLTFTPNLKHASVDMEIAHGSSDVVPTDQLLPDLKKLNSLVFCGSDYRTIKCFRRAKLTTMKIWTRNHSVNHGMLFDFLSSQDKLTSLTFDTWSSSYPWSSPSILVKLNVPIPFQLTQLSICEDLRGMSSRYYDYLVRFIKAQAGNLLDIELGSEIPMSVHECVFANMTKLATLSLITNHLPRDNDFYDRLKENCSVHTIRLLETSHLASDYQFVGRFLQKLPNIRCLIVGDDYFGYLHVEMLVFAQSLSKLESLYIRNSCGALLDCVKFPNLRTLHIENLGKKIDWHEFTKIHPLLTELTIGKMYGSPLTADDIDQITTNIDLQHIKLGEGFVADNKFFEIVGLKCTNLKVLDLHKSCMSQDLRLYSKIGGLRLRDSIALPNVFEAKFLSQCIQL